MPDLAAPASESKVYTNLRSMIDDAQLGGMTCYELRGVRRDAGLDEDAPVAHDSDERADGFEMEAQVYFRVQTSKDSVEVRQRLQVVSDEARFTVDEGVTFEFPGPIEVKPEVRQEFISQVGLMVLYPYMRESLRSLSSKLAVGPVLLPLQRGFDLEPMDPSEVALHDPTRVSSD